MSLETPVTGQDVDRLRRNVTWVTSVEVDVTPRIIRSLVVGAVALSLGLPALAGLSGPVAAAATGGTVHPGVAVNFGGVTCTVGAVMRERKTVYLAVPASCGGIDLGKPQNGCVEPTTPVGSPVGIQGANHRGTVVYNSFSEMQLHGVHATDECHYNDLALIRVNHLDRRLVSAVVPGTTAPHAVPSKLPASGTALHFGASHGTAGSTHHKGWELDASTMAMLSTYQAGSPVTSGGKLVGMLIVLPKGPLLSLPLLQQPAEIYNLSRAIKMLRTMPGFHHVTLVQAGQRP
jgi:hypothetical protein